MDDVSEADGDSVCDGVCESQAITAAADQASGRRDGVAWFMNDPELCAEGDFSSRRRFVDPSVDYSITFNAAELLSSKEISAVRLKAQIASCDTISSIVFSDGEHRIAVGRGDITVSEQGLVSINPQDLSSLVDGTVSVTMTLVNIAGNIGAISDFVIKDTSGQKAG